MTAVLERRQSRAADHRAVPRSFGALLLLLAVALVVNSAIGPLGLDLATYPISDTLGNQLIGLEVVTVLLVVPWCVLAAIRALRDDAAAGLLAFAPAAYTVYMFVQYVLGPEYAEYRLLTLFHLSLVTLSGALTLWAWTLSRGTPAPVRPARTERVHAVALFGLALFVVLRYTGGLAGALTGSSIPGEFAAARTFYWSIFLLDLGVVVPATLVSAVALFRGRDAGRRALYAAAGWFALVPPSVAAMAAVMVMNDDPYASPTTVVVLAVGAVAFGGFAAAVYRPLLAPAR